MRTESNQHATRADLLQWIDQELGPGEEAKLRTHLEECPACRALAGEVKRESGGYETFHVNVLKPSLPDAPGAWDDLESRLADLDREAWWKRFGWVRPAVALAALTVCAIIVWRLERPAAVSAAELLRKATVVEARSSGVESRTRKRIRIRTMSKTWVRGGAPLGGWRSCGARRGRASVTV